MGLASEKETAVANDNKNNIALSLNEKDRDLEHAKNCNENAADTKKKPKSAAEDDDEGKVYPPTSSVALVMIGLYLSIFLVSLDRTIIATAVPRITDEFHSIDDIGWYASAYMITACAFQLIFGKIYTFYSSKWVFLTSVALFELGSLICGVAPNSTALIVGRAVTGLGSAGILSGSIVLTVHIIPLRQRPIYQSFMGAVILISSVVGPIIGGAFTTNLTWRWCFYINLPIGGATIIVLILLLPAKNMNQTEDEMSAHKLTVRQKFIQLDPIGTFFFLPGIVCLLLALQWGGATYAWSDGRIIALWLLFGICMIVFGVVQVWQKENATLPPRILAYRSVTASTCFAFCISGSLMAVIYFLPLWFQAIQNVDAVQSGIRTLPVIIALVVSSIIAGGSVSKLGYYTPFLILCSVIMSIGAGLLMTFKVDTPQPVWIGYQVVFGFGIGLGQQQAGLAAQTVLPVKDVPIGVSLKFFGQQLGGAIFASVAQSVLNQRLVDGLADLAIPGINPAVIASLGAIELREYVGPEFLNKVLVVYNHAIDGTFEVATILAALSLIGALLTEWKSVKGMDIKGA
ncbi:major facilitator superfamily domain-containing protein [Apodospora peruviana]|uniref:Major facilitator superfamily domain-containing protein n=1 Tax=Apodospora peruviana TaxID=516989 RepID=A0AAE0I428_9PEZI|nr:major facilitator superfamily domain-containing protein [Apodospora peruviana]